MINALGLLKQRRFLPLFTTQFLGAFNDNLFKTSMVLFATYAIFNDAGAEANFNALATGISILPFFLLSALAGQLADSHDKARIIRLVKTAEIGIMAVGSAGLVAAKMGHVRIGLGLMLVAVLMLGIHSTFFGPIKYAILPQHLNAGDVLGGTGLVEAGTYLAILMGTVLQMVDNGLGLTMLPEMALQAGILDHTSIVARPLAAENAVRRVALVWRRASPRERDFRLLAEVLAAERG